MFFLQSMKAFDMILSTIICLKLTDGLKNKSHSLLLVKNQRNSKHQRGEVTYFLPQYKLGWIKLKKLIGRRTH